MQGYPPGPPGYPPPGYPPQQPGYPPQQPMYGQQPGYPPQQPMYGQPMVQPGLFGPGGSPNPMAMVASAPYGIEPMSGMPYSDKEKMTAGLLQLFAGAFGAGRFYTGHTGMAIAQIAVTWLTCGIGALWPFIDGIMILTGKGTDAQGRPLR